MELRHLRYFVAVAEEGSLTNAAERRLHTAQPSLSRQIRDLELEVGVPLLERRARGVALTAAGRTFLDHARLALLQVDAAGEGAFARVKNPAGLQWVPDQPLTAGLRARDVQIDSSTIFLPPEKPSGKDFIVASYG